MRDRLVFWRFREGSIAFPPSYRWRKRGGVVMGGGGEQEDGQLLPMAEDFTDLEKLRCVCVGVMWCCFVAHIRTHLTLNKTNHARTHARKTNHRTAYTTSTKQDKEPLATTAASAAITGPSSSHPTAQPAAAATATATGEAAAVPTPAAIPLMPPRLRSLLSWQGERGVWNGSRHMVSPPVQNKTHSRLCSPLFAPTASTASSNHSATTNNNNVSNLSTGSGPPLPPPPPSSEGGGGVGGKEKKSKLRTPSYTDRILTHSLPGALPVMTIKAEPEPPYQSSRLSSLLTRAHQPHTYTHTFSLSPNKNNPPLTGKAHQLAWRHYEMADGVELSDHRPVCAALDLRVDR